MAFLGIIAAGGIFTGLNPSYTVFEIAHAVRTADITHFLVEPEFLPKVLRASKECKITPSNIYAFDVFGASTGIDHGVQSWNGLHLGHEEEDWVRFDDQKQSEETIVARLFSSGTTGLPKAMDLSVSNFVRLAHPTEMTPVTDYIDLTALFGTRGPTPAVRCEAPDTTGCATTDRSRSGVFSRTHFSTSRKCLEPIPAPSGAGSSHMSCAASNSRLGSPTSPDTVSPRSTLCP